MKIGSPLPPVPWGPALLAALAVHSAAIAYLFVTPAQPVLRQTEMPPFAVVLAPAVAPPPQPPSDLTIDQARTESVPRAGEQSRNDVEVITTSRGTLAEVQPVAPAPPALASAAPTQTAAAPPPAPPAPSARQSAAPVEGASAKAGDEAPSWEAQVRTRLERAKRYPAGARIMKQQDTILLSFRVDGNGRVSGARIQRSSGYEELEAEALSLVARVSPLPPPPGGVPKESVVPIYFHLER